MEWSDAEWLARPGPARLSRAGLGAARLAWLGLAWRGAAGQCRQITFNQHKERTMQDYYTDADHARHNRERINRQLEAAAEALSSMPDDTNVYSVLISGSYEKPTLQLGISSFNRLFGGREVAVIRGVKADHYTFDGDIAVYTAVLAKPHEPTLLRVVLPLRTQPHVAEAACEVSINELGEFVVTDSQGYQHVGPKHELEAALDRRDNLVIEDDGE